MVKEKFTDYLTFERRYSPHTILAYTTDLETFDAYIKKEFNTNSLELATDVEIRTWLVHLLENKLAAKSVNRKISTLKSFYRFCMQQKLLAKNPMAKIASPSNSLHLPYFLTTAETEHLFENPASEHDFEQVRDELVLTMLYATGIRRAELIDLQTTNIDFNNATIKVHGKGNKDRIIPIGNQLIEAIKKYLKIKETYFSELKPAKNINSTLFVTIKGNPLYAKQVYNIVHVKLQQISLKGKLSPHVLRHTFATHMLDNGADLNAIKEMLGHASLASTQVYTHNTIEKLKHIYKQAHPRA